MSLPSGKPPSVYYRAFTRDQYKCVYCERDILESFDTFSASHLDHLKPRRFGGSDDDVLNRVTACGVCNHIKGAFDPSPDGPVTAESFDRAVGVARAHVWKKRKGEIPCSYVRDYQYWLKEAGRHG